MFFSFASSSSSSRTLEWKRGDLLWKRDFGGQENRESDSQSVKESWRWPKSRCSSQRSILLHRRLKGKFLANFWHDWKANFFSPLLIRTIISISEIYPNFPPTCAKIIEGKRTPPLEKWVIVQIINLYLKVVWNSHRKFHLQKEPFLNFIKILIALLQNGKWPCDVGV